MLVDVFYLVALQAVDAGHLILLQLLHFDPASPIGRSGLDTWILLRMLAASVRNNLGVRARASIAALVLHKLELLLLLRLFVFLHQAAQEILVVAARRLRDIARTSR